MRWWISGHIYDRAVNRRPREQICTRARTERSVLSVQGTFLSCCQCPKFTNVLLYISTSSLCLCLASNDNRALFFASTERQIKRAEEKQDCRLHLSVKGLRPIRKLCLLSCCHRNISELGDAFWIGFQLPGAATCVSVYAFHVPIAGQIYTL